MSEQELRFNPKRACEGAPPVDFSPIAPRWLCPHPSCGSVVDKRDAATPDAAIERFRSRCGLQSEVTQDTQPSLTALREYAEKLRGYGIAWKNLRDQRHEASVQPEDLVNWADQLDVLITRLDCPTCGGRCVYHGTHPETR